MYTVALSQDCTAAEMVRMLKDCTAPFYFCNNFVKTYYSEMIIGTSILR